MGLQEVWDIHVPRVHHYIANGVVHANSGKSKCGCRESIRWAVTYDGSRHLVARLTFADLRDTTMVTYWKELYEIGFRKGIHYDYNRADKEITWKNGSVTLFRHLDDPNGLGSLELNSAFVDEGSQVSDALYMTLSSSRLRWHLPVCNQQEYVDLLVQQGASDEEIAAVPCNCPRGIWVCTNPDPACTYLLQVTQGKMDSWEWIKAKPGENPYNGPEYYAQMKRDKEINGPIWMKRYYEGDWDAFAGQRFTMFDRERHVLPTTFHPGPEYQIIEGWDFGHRETFVTWLAFRLDREEPIVCFDELQAQEVQDPKDVADIVKEKRRYHKIENRVIAMGDPSGEAATAFSAIGPILAYQQLGIYIAPCRKGKNPQGRADLLARLLSDQKRQWDGSYWPGVVFGPNCTATVDSIINLRWKPPTSRIGEEPREAFLKANDHGFDACLVPGTLVSTPNGGVPIEQLGVGDEVLTRGGPRRVTASWMTSPRASVIEVFLSNGATLVGTGNHLVHANESFVRLDCLSYGDRLTTCQQRPLCSKESSTAATRRQSQRHHETTSAQDPVIRKMGMSPSIERSGNTITDRSPMDTTSITATETPGTTTSPILNAPTRSPTRAYTSPMNAENGCENTQQKSGRSPSSGTHRTPGGSGIAKMGNAYGRTGSRSHELARGAVASFRQSRLPGTSTSAPTSAPPRVDVPAGPTMKTEPARSVDKSGASTATQKHGVVPVHVVSVCEAGESPVYDLTIETDHEFFANGVLVHNCTYALVVVPPAGSRREEEPPEGVNLGVEFARARR